MKGYVQVYTGNGKGKTTAALGLTVRAVGAGLRVYIGQFIKSGIYSEVKLLAERFPEVTLKQYGLGRFVKGKPTDEDIASAAKGIELLQEAMLSGDYDLIIADEANCAVSTGIIGVDKLINIIDNKPENIELVFTGRNADNQIIERANLVSEIKEIKHYFSEGIDARKGIEN